jgi:hypothetical protein
MRNKAKQTRRLHLRCPRRRQPWEVVNGLDLSILSALVDTIFLVRRDSELGNYMPKELSY